MVVKKKKSPEEGLRSEGFADVFRPFKDVAIDEMSDSDVPPGLIAAFDLLTPDSLNFLAMLKNAPQKIMKMAEEGDGKVISMMDFIRKKTGKEPQELAKHAPDPDKWFNDKLERSLSRDDKIKAALDKQKDTNPFASDRQEYTSGVTFSSQLPPSKGTNKLKELPSVGGPEGYQDLANKLSEYPKAVVALKTLSKKGHTEPYYGLSFDNALWSTNNSRFKDIPQPLPVFGKVDVKGHLGKGVAKGGPDPLMWMDTRYGVTKEILREHRDKPLKISTRSDLIAHDDYIRELNPFRHKIEIHITSDHKIAGKRLEPGAPSVQRRLEAARKLKEAGYHVTIVHDRIEGLNPSLNSLDQLDIQRTLGIPVKVNKIKTTPDIRKRFKDQGFSDD